MIKSGKKMSPIEAKAKLASLQELMKEMDDMMLEGMKGKGKMKVSVASDSPEGLKQGLEKAEDALEGESEESESGVTLPKFGSEQEGGAEMDEDSYEDDSSMDEEESEEDLDKKIAELMAKKKSKAPKQI